MSLSVILNADFMNIAKQQSEKTIKADRNKYSDVYNEIESYCKENKLIISDLYVILEQQDTISAITNKAYKVYATNPFRHSNSITNNIHKKTQSKFLKLKTVKEKEEFAIEYDTRQLATIYQLQRHKSIDLLEIINPVKIDGISYMPAEIEIIDIYHRLYDASQFGNYEESLEFEKGLFEQITHRREHGEIKGGDECPCTCTRAEPESFIDNDDDADNNIVDDSDTDSIDSAIFGRAELIDDHVASEITEPPVRNCQDKKRDFIENLKIILVKDWLIKRTDTVLIGAWAHEWVRLGKNLCTNSEKIQIISELPPTKILFELQRFVNEISKFQITMREQELHIPKDFRTRRFTYYMQIKSERGIIEKPFMDVFNCANFDVIPYAMCDGMRLGHKWVILRFLFIDLWIIRVIKKLGLLTENILDKKMAYIWQLIDEFREGYGENVMGNVIEYIGVYRDYSIDKKIQNLSGKMFHPYIPAMAIEKNQQYRDV